MEQAMVCPGLLLVQGAAGRGKKYYVSKLAQQYGMLTMYLMCGFVFVYIKEENKRQKERV